MLNTCMAWTPVCAAESWSDFISVIVPTLFGSCASTSDGEPELRADLHDQLVRVERDDAVAGRDPVTGLVLEDGDELLVGDRAGVG